jgi:hypothetical protein
MHCSASGGLHLVVTSHWPLAHLATCHCHLALVCGVHVLRSCKSIHIEGEHFALVDSSSSTMQGGPGSEIGADSTCLAQAASYNKEQRLLVLEDQHAKQLKQAKLPPCRPHVAAQTYQALSEKEYASLLQKSMQGHPNECVLLVAAVPLTCDN